MTRTLQVRFTLPLLVGVAALLAALAAPAMLTAFARATLYPAPPVPVRAPPPGFVELRLPLGDGHVVAWARRRPTVARSDAAFASPGARSDAALPRSSRPLLLFLHGNGENLQTMLHAGTFAAFDELGADVVAVDYPGYGRSPGVPSEASLLASAETALGWAREQGPTRIYACGWSLGAAVAVAVAARHPDLAGLVALSPWSSLAEVARLHFPGWLVGLALTDRYDSLVAAPRVRVPSLVVHGARDGIIPAAQGERLAAALRARWVSVPSAGHNDLLAEPVVWDEIARFLRGTGTQVR